VIINQVKQKLHLVGYLLIQYFKDARYHEHKKKEMKIHFPKKGSVLTNCELLKIHPSERKAMFSFANRFVLS